MHKQVLEVHAAGAGARASRHPEQHEQPGAALDSSGQHAEAAAMHRQVLELQSAGAGARASAHPDQHEQPGVQR